MNRRCLGLSAFVVFLCVLSLSSSAQVAGQNINMVSGTQPIGGTTAERTVHGGFNSEPAASAGGS